MTQKGPRQKTLLNLRVYFDIEKSKWRELCRLIEKRLGGYRQITAFDPDAELNRLAEQIVFRLTDKTIKEQASGRALYDGLPGSVATGQVRSVGGEWVCLGMIKRLGVDKKTA